ncbi:hypothetical protein CAC42_5004 [Sphaceloma murrayae]|uniref:La n=1 Tax=Sphaceloma murrayae TaxID=2082308 RepID=A0A2K1QQ42_9PEZI|nr:hypothetical protein CAC42_5004 [Sphaceloma murrayae]
MSEVGKDPAVPAAEVEVKENGAKEVEAQTAPAAGGDQATIATETAEAKDETQAQDGSKVEKDAEKNGTDEKDEKNAGDKTKDEIDEKIDRYARETKRPFQKKQFRKHFVRSNFENLPETDDPEEIRRQVEFYFSEANLPTDAFLLQSTGGPENRPFPLKQLHTFKRMRRFQPYTAVLEAVKESKMLNVDEQGEITRKTPLSEDYDPDDVEKNKRIYEEKSLARSIYAKGFGSETETTQTDIEEFFAPYGDVSAVRLRRHSDGEFKGTVLVEFSDEATAKSFLELDPKPKWRGDQTLQFQSKAAWVEEKGKQEAARPPRKEYDRRDNKRKFDNGGGGGRGRYNDDRRGGKHSKRGGRRDDRGDGPHSGERRRDRDDKTGADDDWRERRNRDRGQHGKRGDRRRGSNDKSSKRDRDDAEDKREEKSGNRSDNEDQTNKMAKTKKRERDDTDAGAEREAKKVKEDTNTKASDEVSAAA